MDFRKNYFELDERKISEIRATLSLIDLYSKRFVKLLVNYGDSSWDPNIWVYTGVDRDYVIIPRIYCSCTSFAIEVLSGRKRYCKHLIYQLASYSNKNYRILIVSDETLYKVISEIMDLEKSVTLRRILYRGVEDG